MVKYWREYYYTGSYRAPRALFPKHVRTPVTHTPAPARDRTLPTTTASQLGSCPASAPKSRNRRSSSVCKKMYFLSQTLLLHTESSPDLFESVQPPKFACTSATWVYDAHQGVRTAILPDVQIWWILTIHAHWRVLHGFRRLLAPLNAVRKRLRRVSTGFDSRCTQYLRNLLKFSSKKVITDPSGTDVSKQVTR